MIYTAWHSLPPERIPTNMPLSSSLFDYIFPDALVLDVGCGHGRLAPCMTEKGAVYYGIDINKAAIHQANTLLLPHASFSAQDAECTDFSDGFFDMIIAQGTLACMDLEGRMRAAHEMRRVARQGAVIHVTELQQSSDDAYYRKQETKTGEYGTVQERKDGSFIGYQTHHFSKHELLDLFSEECTILHDEAFPLVTKNGNAYHALRMLFRRL